MIPDHGSLSFPPPKMKLSSNMYITRVHLENFKRHQEITREFAPGVNAIFGPNGAGKTSIIEAIGFGLFDYSPYRKQSELIRKGAKSTTIAIEFVASVDQSRYLLKRHLTESTSKLQLFAMDDKSQTLGQICEGRDDVYTRLRELLLVDRETDLGELFSSMLGVPQGTMTSIFLAKDSDRKKVFDPILGVEVYERTKLNMRDVFIKPLKEQLHALSLDIARLQGQISVLPAMTEEWLLMQTTLQTNQLEYAKHQERQPQLAQILEHQRNLQTELHQLEQQRLQLQLQQQHLVVQQQELAPQLREAEEAQHILQEEQERYLRHQEAERQRQSLREKQQAYQNFREQIQQCDQQCGQLDIQLQSKRQEDEELRSLQKEWKRLSPLLQEQAEQTRHKDQAQQAKNQEDIVQQELQDLTQEMQSLEQTAQQKQQRIAELAQLQYALQALDAITKEGLALKEELPPRREQQRQREFLLEQIQKQSETLQSKKQAIEDNKHRLGTLQHRYLGRAGRYTDLEESVQKSARQLAQLETRCEQEKQFVQNVSGGLCPYFQSPCQNVPAGRHLDEFITAQVQRWSDSIVYLRKQLHDLEKDRDEAQKAQYAWNTESTRLQTQILQWEQDFQQSTQDKQRLEQELLRYPDQTAWIQQTEQRIEQLREEYRRTESSAKQAKEWDIEQKALQSLQETLQQKTRSLLKKQALARTLQEQSAPLVGILKRLEELEDPCLRARLYQERIQKMPEIAEQIAQLTQELQQWHAQRASQQQAQDALGYDENNLLFWQKEVEQTQIGYQRYLLHQQVAEKRQDLLVRQQELHQKYQEIQEQCQRCEHEYQQKSAAFDIQAFNQRVEEERMLFGRMKELERDIKNQIHRQTQLQQNIERLQQAEQILQETQSRYTRIDTVRNGSEFLREIYERAKPEITRLMMASVSEEARRIFSQLMNNYRLHLRWEDHEKDRYALIVEEDGKDRSFANLSGGEQMAAALALRMALIKELSDIRIAFLDEPTAHMDEERRRNLATQIAQIQGFQQLFVISHDDTFDQYTHHIVHIP